MPQKPLFIEAYFFHCFITYNHVKASPSRNNNIPLELLGDGEPLIVNILTYFIIVNIAAAGSLKCAGL